MVTKATTTKEEVKTVKKVVKKPVIKKVSQSASATPVKSASKTYVYAVGRRKTAVAQVRLYPNEEAGNAVALVNKKAIREYFGTEALEAMALSPLKLVGLESAFEVSVVVRGGGLHGQADAIKLGIARSLIKHDVLLRAILKSAGMLTRDARAVERKKPGLKKARRSPQWAKR